MKLTHRPHRTEQDFWRVRNFLRESFLLNDRLERGWNVARIDYWRWHLIMNCHERDSLESSLFLWETEDGEIAAVLNYVVIELGDGEAAGVEPFTGEEVEKAQAAVALKSPAGGGQVREKLAGEHGDQWP